MPPALRHRWAIRAFTALCLAVAAAPSARAETPAEFYRGKTVRLVNGGAAGSGYDLYSRMLAPWLAKEMGANVIVESRPGAGMLTAMNHVWTAPPDGLTLMLAPGEGAVLAKLTDEPGVRFDLTKFPILARVNTAPRVLIVNPKGPYRTMADFAASKKQIFIGANGKTDGASDTSAVLCHALKLNCKIMIGYPSSKEFAMAAMRGEVDGTVLVDDSASRYSEGEQLRPIGVTSREHSSLMPDVPTVFEVLKIDTEAAWWLDFREDVRKIGRLLIVPPGTDPERIAFLRSVSRKVLNDPEAVAEFAARFQPVLYGEPEEVGALVKRVLDGSLGAERIKEIKYVITEQYY
ncbi:MAG: Tripartite-type tricarboxylate transporter, receptor component TctC [Hyphomicrobiales bacterium]|nr:Tripartite-type tricarboxylate transporter, receptor component TctC [Hyphomicrobiales bacterium]